MSTSVTANTYSLSDFKFETIEEYFDETVSLKDIDKMSSEELTAYFEELYAKSEITPEEFSAFMEKFEEELQSIQDEAYMARRELNDLLNDDGLSATDVANIELAIMDLEEVEEMCDGDYGLESTWGEAETNYNNKNVTIGYGESTSVTFSDVGDGQTVKIDASATEDTAATVSAFSAEDTEGLVDIDGDGVLSEDEYYDKNHDGIADDDFNKDGVTDEKDSPFYAVTNPTSITIELGENDSISLASFDDSTVPPTTTLRIVKENGDVCYLEYLGRPTVYCAKVPDNLSSIPTALTSTMFESTTSTHPYSYYESGYDPKLELDTYTVVSMSDHAYAYTVTPTTEDFETSREYTINCSSGKADALTIDLSQFEDANITASENEDGDVVFSISTSEGTIKITVKNLQYSTAAEKIDTISFTGGKITESSYDFINAYAVDSAESGADDLIGGLSALITVDGEDLTAVAENEGYDTTITSYSMSSSDHQVILKPSEDDFKSNTDYTIQFDSESPDVFDLTLPDDAVVNFEADAEGNLVLRITSDAGEITITLIGVEFTANDTGKTSGREADLINITGGDINPSEENYDNLCDIAIPDSQDGEEWEGGYFVAINYNGISLWEHAIVTDEYYDSRIGI